MIPVARVIFRSKRCKKVGRGVLTAPNDCKKMAKIVIQELTRRGAPSGGALAPYHQRADTPMIPLLLNASEDYVSAARRPSSPRR